MADGRMLKKQISQSRRLADLQTDGARMLYTWIIPHLDIEGRMSADPDVLKGQVVPRLKNMTPEIISEYLQDMHSVGVVTLFEFDGDKYLQLRKFKDHQSLRPGKEAESRIPPPDSLTPVQVPDKDGSSPAEDKIREEKLSKANTREEEKTPPVDNSLEPPENPPLDEDKLRAETQDLAEQVINAYGLKIQTAISKIMGEAGHHLNTANKPAAQKALVWTLNRMLEEHEKGETHADRYWQDIYLREMQDNNAAQFDGEEVKRGRGIASAKAILGQIGQRAEG